jgi:voltage-gated potassium channel
MSSEPDGGLGSRDCLRNFLRARKEDVLDLIAGATRRRLRNGDQRVIRRLVRQATVDPLILQPDRITWSHPRDADADASESAAEQRHRRVGPRQPLVVVHVPCTGEDELWDCHPEELERARWMPDVNRGRVSMQIMLPHDGEITVDWLEREIRSELQRMKEWVQHARAEVEAHNASLQVTVAAAVEQRLSDLNRLDAAMRGLRAADGGLGIARDGDERAASARNYFELPVLLAALLVVPVIFVEEQVVSDTWQRIAYWTNWGIWAVFLLEFVVVVGLARSRWAHARKEWLNVVIIVSSFPLLHSLLAYTRLLRLVRLGRLLRLARAGRLAPVVVRGAMAARVVFSKQGVGYMLVLTLLLALGAGGLFSLFEEPDGMTEGLWWAFVTLTTVGYGDLVPATSFGRSAGVLLMFVGIGFVAMLTAAVAAHFVKQEDQQEGSP